jgi:hypothetical protein
VKIREYIGETAAMTTRFEEVAASPDFDPGELMGLFDAILWREGDVSLWFAGGLTVEDDVPEYPNKIIWPRWA